MHIKGIITRIFLTRGYGFIRGDDGLDYFMQTDACEAAWSGETLHAGVRVEFLPASGGAGGNGLRAVGVKVC